MQKQTGRLIAVLTTIVLLAGPALAAISAPKGGIVERNIDLAAENAFDTWIESLQKAPHTEEVQYIGILPLAGDNRDFTALLAEKLTQLKRFHVVILSGKEWMAIEDELARTDPDAGFGDIMDKASIKWKELRDSFTLPETAKGADAILLGRIRSTDGDWLRARIRFTLHLAKVDTRTQIAGGIAEGESVMAVKDLLIYYKVALALAVVALIVLLIVLGFLRSIAKKMARPR
ncbi:MAG: hypothetical protein JXR37_15360 [Kiritimatiellae bacterium]|nr:hypothetical protein [Kiritimatiellia bacterium]